MPLPCLPFLRPLCCRAFVATLPLVLAVGCAQVPELDATVPKQLDNAAYPALVPLDGSLTTVILPATAASDIEASLVARRDRLQAKASQLNEPIVDPKAKARMKAGISR